MADNKVTEDQAAELLSVLQSDIILDKKVQYVTNIKSSIKQHNVPEACVPQLFDGLRAAASSQHNAIVNVGFTALNHLLTRLSRQDPKLLGKEAARTLPLVIDKLGDHRDKYRATAMQALNTLYGVNPGDVERFIRNSAMTGKNPRAKESAMHWLLQTHQEQGLQFRSYVPLLMDLLEDADGMVRDVAKSTVIELFRNAPNTAKSDLKRQLKNFKVRPAIEQAIVKELAPNGARPETPAAAAAAPAPRPALGASVSSMSSERPITPAVDTRAENIEPQYVNTNRELDDIFKGMAWFFEGRETEQNWMKREESMVTLRRLNAGNATSDFPETFLAGLRAMLDGIIKAVNSLRTSLSKEGCGLVQDIAIAFGPAMDPMVELLMQTFVKLSAGTKKISSQQANTTVDTILSNVSYSQRLMQHIWIAFQDKNVAPRTYATGWLKTMLKKEAKHKSHVEHTGGVDLIEKCIKKGLGDANPAVREKTRSVYWTFWEVWPQRADAIMEDLDGTAQKLLNKDPSNPNAPKTAQVAARPGLGLSRSTMTAAKPSLRETMMAQKKATLSAKNLPARPGSAMANISPVRKVSDPKQPSAAPASKPSGSRARPEAGTVSVNASSMSVAPMRPTRRRPEMAARPATAGPYSVRDRGEHIEPESPRALKAKPAPKPKETTPRRTAQRTRPGHASHASESSITSPVARPRSVASNRVSPTRLKTSRSAVLSSSPAAKANEDLTLVVPHIPAPQAPTVQQSNTVEEELVKPHVEDTPEKPAETFVEPQPSSEPARPVAVLDPDQKDAPQPVKVYEDPFVESEQEPKPVFTGSVLEDKPVNEDAANVPKANGQTLDDGAPDSPDKVNKNARLLDSGIAKIKSKSLEVHGFRKLQSLLRDNKTSFTDDKFQDLLLGLFQFLEDPLPSMPADKALDVKAQVLTTIKLLLRRERDNFKPHVSKCLESLLETRSRYEGRAHITSGLELLADELVTLGDPPEVVVVLGQKLQGWDDTTPQGCRALSTGLHVLKAMLEKQQGVVLSDAELARLAELTGRCLESTDSGVRMDAVQLCVALHSCVGEERFWNSLKDAKEDPKSLITYYIIKRQREQGDAPAA